MKYAIKDNSTGEIIKNVYVSDEDEFIELDEMAAALGFYLEEIV